MRLINGTLRAATILSCASLFACSFSSTTYYRDSEGRFSAQIIEAIEPEATTKTWLQKQLGNPLWVDQAANEVSIYTWPLTREQYKRKELLLVLRTRNVVEESEYLHVVLQQGVVVKHWLDSHAQVDVERITYALGLDKPISNNSILRSEPTAPVSPVKVTSSVEAAPLSEQETVDISEAQEAEVVVEASVQEDVPVGVQEPMLSAATDALPTEAPPNVKAVDAKGSVKPSAKTSSNLYGI